MTAAAVVLPAANAPTRSRSVAALAEVGIVVGRVVMRAIPMLIIVTGLTFVLVSFIPGDPALSLLGENATPEQIERVRAELGLDAPLWQQYLQWAGAAVRGDFGQSFFSGAEVSRILADRLVPTLSLLVSATLVAAVLGVVLGAASALRGGWLGRFVDALSLLGVAIPSFWLGLVLIQLFAVSLRILPPTGYTSPATDPLDWLLGLVLPVAALSLSGITLIAGTARESFRDTMGSRFVLTLRGNGFRRSSIIGRHVFRNSAIPIITFFGVVFVKLLSGAVVIESVFAIPGIGSAAVQAAKQHDLPVILGAVVYFTIMVIIVNLIIDLLYSIIDPRVRVRG